MDTDRQTDSRETDRQKNQWTDGGERKRWTDGLTTFCWPDKTTVGCSNYYCQVDTDRSRHFPHSCLQATTEKRC